MVVNGIFLDQVEEAVKDLLASIRDLALRRCSPDLYHGAVGRLESFWRTLIFDEVGLTEQAPSDTGEDLKVFRENLDGIIVGGEDMMHSRSDSFEDWLRKKGSNHGIGRLFRT
jgi:hypothetical protein